MVYYIYELFLLLANKFLECIINTGTVTTGDAVEDILSAIKVNN